MNGPTTAEASVVAAKARSYRSNNIRLAKAAVAEAEESLTISFKRLLGPLLFSSFLLLLLFPQELDAAAAAAFSSAKDVTSSLKKFSLSEDELYKSLHDSNDVSLPQQNQPKPVDGSKRKILPNSENEEIIIKANNGAFDDDDLSSDSIMSDSSPAYDDATQDYLVRYGYLPQSNREMSNLRMDDAVQLALTRLQQFAGIPPTGLLDQPTRRLMNTKRCGLPDVPYDGVRRRRRKRYVLHGSKWHKFALTYKVQNSARYLDLPRTRRTLYDAFAVWSKDSTVSFQEIADDPADIVVKFATREHGDNYPFDGPNVVLAHAFFPAEGLGGDIHFDDDERWTDRPLEADKSHSRSVNLISTAAHEIGHSLGLGHSKERNSLMFPYYRSGHTEVKLEYDDILAIQKLYGIGRSGAPNPPRPVPTTTEVSIGTTKHSERQTPPAHPSTTAPPIPEPCSARLDAVAKIRNEVFVFKDKFYWRYNEAGSLIDLPNEINRFWFGLPHNLTKIDAIYERADKDRVIIFVGRHFYEFSGNRLRHRARNITDFGLPSDIDRIDAAFVWDYNERTYLFAGERYWRFDENKRVVEPDYPRQIESVWMNLPREIDAAFTDKTGITYFFKDNLVYKFNNYFMRVDRNYPRPSNEFWQHCTKQRQYQQLNLVERIKSGVSFLKHFRIFCSLFPLVVVLHVFLQF